MGAFMIRPAALSLALLMSGATTALAQSDFTGTWEVAVCEFRGAANESIRANYVLEMTKGQTVFVEKNGKRTLYPMRLDSTTSPPSFTWATGARVGYVGSYRLHKNEMVIIFAPGERVADRPVDFAGQVTWKYVLRRTNR